jgi:hypothetical protein
MPLRKGGREEAILNSGPTFRLAFPLAADWPRLPLQPPATYILSNVLPSKTKQNSML